MRVPTEAEVAENDREIAAYEAGRDAERRRLDWTWRRREWAWRIGLLVVLGALAWAALFTVPSAIRQFSDVVAVK